MEIALQSGEDEEHLQFIRQLGLTHVVSGASAGPDGVLALDDLKRRKAYFAERGFVWDVIENLPPLCYDKVMFGSEGRDEQI